MAKFTFAMTDTQIGEGIEAIAKTAKSLREQMHKVAVSILARWAVTGDVSAAANQASALLAASDGAHKQKVVNWFAVNAGFELLTSDEGDQMFGYDASRTTTTKEQVQAARKESMFDLTKDAAPKAFDLPARIAALVTQAEKALGRDTPVEGDNVSRETVDKLKALMAA